MLKPIDGLAAGVIGVRAVGQFTIDDYTTVIQPALDKLAAGSVELRLLLYLGPEFDGFGEGAWGELTDEIRHVRFHSGAVVTDIGHIRTEVNILKWLLHGDVRTFHIDEYENAARWVAS